MNRKRPLLHPLHQLQKPAGWQQPLPPRAPPAASSWHEKSPCASQQARHKGNPHRVVDIVPRPFSFCKGKRHRVKHPPLQQNPPELENLPHAGPRSKYPAARGRGGSESLTPFLCSPLFAFFMRTVSHTLARQHRCCAALFYSGDSLRFPAYNGNEMPPSIRTPPWYTNHDACCSVFCAALFGSLRAGVG